MAGSTNSQTQNQQLMDLIDRITRLSKNTLSLEETLKQYGHVGQVNGVSQFSGQAKDIYDDTHMAEEAYKLVSSLRSAAEELDKLKKDTEAARKKWQASVRANSSDIAENKKAYDDLNKQLNDLSSSIQETRNNVKKARKNNPYIESNLSRLKSVKSLSEAQLRAAIELEKKLHDQSRFLEEVNKELTYRNRLERDGVTLQEKINHSLESRNINVQRFRNGIDEVSRGFNKAKSAIVSFLEPYAKLNQTAADFAKTVGMTRDAYLRYQRSFISQYINGQMGARYGVSMTDAIKGQQALTTNLGRRVIYNNGQAEDAAAIAAINGGDTSAAANVMAAFDKLGLSPTQAAEKYGEMFNTADKYGLAFDKYSKNILDNIQLAQTYTFQGGLNGLEKMAKRATELNLNMNQMAQAADKLSNVEGSMKAGASLSVLGGPFAQMGDPMSMLYESLNDLGSLQERIGEMFGKFAHYNSETGELEVSAFNRQRIKAASDALGINYNEMMNSVFTQGRRNFLSPLLNGRGLTDEQKDAIINQSTVEKGHGYVTVNGEKKDVTNLTKEDIDLTTKTSKDVGPNVRTIAQTTLGMEKIIQGMAYQVEGQKAYWAETSGIGGSALKILEFAQDHSRLLSGILAGVTMISSVVGFGMGVGGMINGGATAIGGIAGRGMRFGGTSVAQIRRDMGPTPVGYGGYIPSDAYLSKSQRRQLKAVMKKQQNGELSGRQARMQMDKIRGVKYGNRVASNFGSMKYGVAMGLGAAGLIGGNLLSSSAQESFDSNDFSSGAKAKAIGGGALSGAGTGAMIGATVGSIIPILGTTAGAAIGAAIGGIWGGMSANGDAKKQQMKQLIYEMSHGTLGLRGDYSIDDLKKIYNYGTSGIDQNLWTKIRSKENMTTDDVQRLMNSPFQGAIAINDPTKYPRMRNGGIVRGVGSGTSDSNIAMLSRGEFVVPASAVAKPFNRYVLERMRGGSTIVPRMRNGGIVTPIGNRMKTVSVKHASVDQGRIGGGTTNITFGPLNISGTIRLEMNGNSRDINSKAILNNPVFMKQLTDTIAKRISTEIHLGYDKNSFYKKF